MRIPNLKELYHMSSDIAGPFCDFVVPERHHIYTSLHVAFDSLYLEDNKQEGSDICHIKNIREVFRLAEEKYGVKYCSVPLPDVSEKTFKAQIGKLCGFSLITNLIDDIFGNYPPDSLVYDYTTVDDTVIPPCPMGIEEAKTIFTESGTGWYPWYEETDNGYRLITCVTDAEGKHISIDLTERNGACYLTLSDNVNRFMQCKYKNLVCMRVSDYRYNPTTGCFEFPLPRPAADSAFYDEDTLASYLFFPAILHNLDILEAIEPMDGICYN